MTNKLHHRCLILWFFLLTVALTLSCSGDRAGNNTSVPPSPQRDPSPAAANTNAGQVIQQPDQTDAGGEGFSTSAVCSLPATAAPGSPFAALGGGIWERWDDAETEWNYGCSGGRDSIMVEETVAKIRAGYSVLGDADAVHVVSASYAALQYGGKTKEEAELRPKYASFCDGLSKGLLGQPLPEKFRSRLMNESTYSESAEVKDYTEKVGKGLVALNARKEKDQMVRLEVSFFQSEAEYNRFKNS